MSDGVLVSMLASVAVSVTKYIEIITSNTYMCLHSVDYFSSLSCCKLNFLHIAPVIVAQQPPPKKLYNESYD